MTTGTSSAVASRRHLFARLGTVMGLGGQAWVGRRGTSFVYAAALAGTLWTVTLGVAGDPSGLWSSAPMTRTAAQAMVAGRDDTPARVLLVPRRDLLPGTTVVSNTLRLSGITVPVGVLASHGAEVSVAGRPWTAAPQAAERGEPIQLRATVPAVSTTLTVLLTTGTVVTPWTITAADAPAHSHQMLLGPWSQCSAAAPCTGTGTQTRERLCLRSDGRFVPSTECDPDLSALQSRDCPSPAGDAACLSPPAGSSGWTQYCAAGSSVRSACTGSLCGDRFTLEGASCVQSVFDACAADSAPGGWSHAALAHGGLAVAASRATPAGSLPPFASAASDSASVSCDDGTASAGAVSTTASACQRGYRLSAGTCLAGAAGTTVTFASGGTVAENQAGATVGTLRTDDPDSAAGDITYALIAGMGSTDNGSFSLTPAGVLSAAVALDFEAASSRSVRVEAFDGANRWQAVVTVQISDVQTALSAASCAPGLYSAAAFGGAGGCIFDFTGSDVPFAVPAEVFGLTATLWGGAGGGGNGLIGGTFVTASGGAGGLTTASIAVAPGQGLVLTIGGGGTLGMGGGRSGIARAGSQLAIAGGGGGAGETGHGGAGGGASGDAGSATSGVAGGGGQQSAGGSGGDGVAIGTCGFETPPAQAFFVGRQLQGGWGKGGQCAAGETFGGGGRLCDIHCGGGGGGGGGGWWGGGGGSGGVSNQAPGGGGGSGYCAPGLTACQTLKGSGATPPAGGNDRGTAAEGRANARGGHGRILLRW